MKGSETRFAQGNDRLFVRRGRRLLAPGILVGGSRKACHGPGWKWTVCPRRPPRGVTNSDRDNLGNLNDTLSQLRAPGRITPAKKRGDGVGWHNGCTVRSLDTLGVFGT
jgi:hypothetical protein